MSPTLPNLVLATPPFGHVPLLDRLAPARAAGFDGISILPGDIWALEEAGLTGRDIATRIADAGLTLMEVDCIGCWLPSHYTHGGTSEIDKLLRSLTPERIIEAAARVGGRSITVVEMMGITPSVDEGAEAFARLCDLAAPHGLNVHIEFLPCGGIPDLASAWAIVQAAGRPNGGLTMDSWHLFRSGSSLDLLATIPGDRIHTVQINDAPAVPQDDLLEETMTARLIPGEGSFDLTGFIRTLDQIGSTAPISVEIFSTDCHTRPMADVIRPWAEAAQAILHHARTAA